MRDSVVKGMFVTVFDGSYQSEIRVGQRQFPGMTENRGFQLKARAFSKAGAGKAGSKLAPSWQNLWSLLPDNNEGAAFAAASLIVAMIATGISLYNEIGTTDRETFINNSY